MNSSRLRAGLVLALVVLSSLVAGAAIDRAVLTRGPHRSSGRSSPEQDARRRREVLERLTRELTLSAPQRRAIDSIMQRTDSSLRLIRREMQPRIRQLFDSSRAQIAARLDSTQRVKYQALVARRDRHGGR